MKKILFLISLTSTIGYSQVGVGTTLPDATLDIVAANATGASTNVDGILIPRVDRQRAQNMTGTVTSTLIYVNSIATGTATGTAANITSTGFYFYDGSVWQKISAGANTNWSLTGNSGTTAGTNFIGTTDNTDIRIKTGTTPTDRWNISHANNGQLQSYSLGTATLPTYSFQGDTDTGVFSSGANSLDLSTGGSARFRIPNANQVHGLSLGTAALPFYSFAADTGIGMWSPTTSTLAFSTAGTERMRLFSDGRTVINNTTAAATDQFSVYSTADPISAYASSGISVYGSASASGGVGLYGTSAGTSTLSLPIYGYNSATNSGTGFTYNSVVASIFGDALKSGNYKFGMYGYGGTSKRSGGVMGNTFDAAFGSLGYFSNGSVNYSFYGFGTATFTGIATGKMASGNLEKNNHIGLGVYGGVMGGWIRGSKYGFHTKGEIYSLYVDGDSYVNKPMALLTETNNGKVATYMTTAEKPEVTCNGKSNLVNGKIFILFSSDFTKMISDIDNIIINVTPQGNSNGIYVSEITKDGFWVHENNNGSSNVKLFWSASTSIQDDDRHDVPSDLLSKDFDRKMDGLMSNDYYSNGNPQSLWWDGTKIRWDNYEQDKNPISEPKVKPKTVNTPIETGSKK